LTENYADNAFARVRAALRGDRVSAPAEAMPPPYSRLLAALQRGNASQLDLAVLTRHALRCEERFSGAAPVVEAQAAAQMPSAAQWRNCGITATARNGGFVLQAQPWEPTWLPDVPDNGVDGFVASETERRTRTLQPPADPFLPYITRGGVRFDRYRSPGQKAAMRAALLAPPGSTLVVSLPTGEGKSLIFQAIARLGFETNRYGVTVVVTPTVALALDHEQSARRLGFGDGPFAYRAGDDANNRVLSDRIRDGTQELLFASPEAVCGSSITSALEDAARSGRLRALVVDEAHLIDSWGINFRPDFQVLSAVRQSWLADVEPANAFRTALLSATLTPDTIDTLETLFPPRHGGRFGVSSAARLRPEIEYWVAPETSGEDRIPRVEEALLHLPRPCILYTTQRWQAQDWLRRAKQLGFLRVDMVTGESSATHRQRVIEAWSGGDLDLAIGTSAFGLGIDNPHVRAVIHACVPETLDRFYQEVGRGGRDGHASLSLILPSPRDRRIAARLNSERLLTIEKAEPRWRSMFLSPLKKNLGDRVFELPMDVPPGLDPERIDMVSERSKGWNVRTLTLLGSMGAIDLLNSDFELEGEAESTSDREDDEPDDATKAAVGHRRPFMKVRIINTSHMTDEFWQQTVNEYRGKRAQTGRASLDRLTRYFEGKECIACILGPNYRVPADPARDIPQVEVGESCGGCPACRHDGLPVRERQAGFTQHPWPPHALDPRLTALLQRNGHLVVCLGDAKFDRRGRQDVIDGLRRLVRIGVKNFIFMPDAEVKPHEILPEDPEIEPPAAYFIDDQLPGDLPPGCTAVLLTPTARLLSSSLNQREPESGVIWVTPHAVRHPSRPDLAFCDLPPGRPIQFADFLGRL
jgi:ATP-dependent DNA helicase RecQ